LQYGKCHDALTPMENKINIEKTYHEDAPKKKKNMHNQTMQRKVDINHCEKCALKKRNTRTPK
jgi:hypothetical protein